MYGLSLPSAKENLCDTWNTVQDLCVFVSNQEVLVIKGTSRVKYRNSSQSSKSLKVWCCSWS